MNIEREEDKTNIEPAAPVERLVMREGYCCDCANNSAITSVANDSKVDGDPCNGCWFTDDKQNWVPKGGKQYYTDDGALMNADGSRSIFDDVDA